VQLTNRYRTPVDPVPFLVVTALGFLVSYSYGPIYCMAFGLSLPAALGVSTGTFCVITAISYHRLVWTSYPELRDELPAANRLQGLLYTTLVVATLLVLLSIPLLLE